MFNKSLIKGALALTAIGLLPSFAVEATSPYEHRQQMQQGYKSSSSNPSTSMDNTEQQFASQLSDLHRQVFMSQFNGMQRAEAMALVQAEKGRKYGRKMTPDMAVEQVMKNHRGVQTGQGQMMPQNQGSSYPRNQGSTNPRTQGSMNNQGQGSNNNNQGSSKYSGSSKNYQSPYYRQQQQNQKSNQQNHQYQYDDDEDSMYNDQNSTDNNQNSQNYNYNQQSQGNDNSNQDSSSTKKKWWQRDNDNQSSSSSSSNSKQKKGGYWD